MSQGIRTTDYRCPGESYAISFAVHLGRLASFHPACRGCPRRDDTNGLSARQTRQLAEIASWAAPCPLFQAEGVSDAAINDLGPDVSKRIAVEFARRIAAVGSRSGVKIAVASDGRPATGAIFAAIVEGIRWTGGEAVDLGPASAPCTARAIEHLAADGGILAGRAQGGPHSVGLKFWAHSMPLSQGGPLDEIAASYQVGADAAMDRPGRTFGRLRHFAAATFYLDELRPAYHALRPLRWVLDCGSAPVISYLQDLLRNTACQVIPAERSRGLDEQVTAARAHFGVRIDDDGENCRVVDERGRWIKAASLLALDENLAVAALRSQETRQQTFLRMRECGAAVALDTAGRLWYAADHAPLPDALRTITWLLVLLSRNDRHLSERLRAREEG